MADTAAQSSRFRWDTEWRSALFAAVFIPLFIALGFWQLSRAEEKRVIAQRWEIRQQQSPVALSQLPQSADDVAYRPVILTGSFLSSRSFLLDNRIRDGRYGVEVLTPYRLDDGTTVLVNRGWLAGDRYRRSLPDVPSAEGVGQLKGYVYVPPGESYTLGSISATDEWPMLVQAIEVPALATLLKRELWPWTVRLSASSPAALEAEWPLINTRPEKHTAYAVQWFAMAAVLALFALWRNSNLPELLGRQPDDEGDS